MRSGVRSAGKSFPSMKACVAWAVACCFLANSAVRAAGSGCAAGYYGPNTTLCTQCPAYSTSPPDSVEPHSCTFILKDAAQECWNNQKQLYDDVWVYRCKTLYGGVVNGASPINDGNTASGGVLISQSASLTIYLESPRKIMGVSLHPYTSTASGLVVKAGATEDCNDAVSPACEIMPEDTHPSHIPCVAVGTYICLSVGENAHADGVGLREIQVWARDDRSSCPENSHNAAAGTLLASLSDCVCNSGFSGTSPGAWCTGCGDGTFMVTDGTGGCSRCDEEQNKSRACLAETLPGTYCLGSDDSQRCPTGQQLQVVATNDCLVCSRRPDAACSVAFRMYFDNVTRKCEYCPVNKNVVNSNDSSASCDFPLADAQYQVWNANSSQYECVPGFTPANAGGCEQCSKRTYKDTLGLHACTTCPGGTTARSRGSISVQDCAFCGFDERLEQSRGNGSFSCQQCEHCTLMREAVHMHKTCSVCGFGDYSRKAATAPPYGTMCILSQCLGVVSTDDHELGENIDMIAIPVINDILYGFMTSLSRPDDDTYDMHKIFGAEPLFYLEVNELPKPNEALLAVLLHTSLQNFGFWLLLEQMLLCTSNDEEICFETQEKAYQQKMWELIPVYNALRVELVASQVRIAMPAPEQGNTAAHEAKCRGGQDTTIRLEGDNIDTHDAFELVTSIFFLDEPLERSSCAQPESAAPACTSMFVYGREQVRFSQVDHTITFEDLSRFKLADIRFEVHSATGANRLKLTVQHSSSGGSSGGVQLTGRLDWSRPAGVPQYVACDKSTEVRATITDPVVFNTLQEQFLPLMCANIGYA